MLCKHCGSEMPDEAIFCSHCGTRLIEAEPEIPEAAAPETPAEEPVQEPAQPKAAPQAPAAPAQEPPRKPFLEEMQWDVSEYPDSNVVEKTEDINFDWNTDPDKVPDAIPRRAEVIRPPQPPKTETKSPEGIRVAEIFDRVVPTEEVKEARETVQEGEDSALGELGRFHTFNRKNAEFQELLDREYAKIKDAGTIGKEQSRADKIAEEKFDSRHEEMTMDEFLDKEGAVKLYEPKPLQSDVLARIEAQEKQRARQKAEEEARAKALEEARAEAEARKKAEIDRLNSEEEASAAAAEEIRLAEEEEIRQRTEEEARRRAAAEAAHLEAIAARKAEQEQAARRLEEQRLAEEARRKAEEEARAKAEAEAKAKAEAEAARAAEEEARQKAEAELNAAREAARIRAQQEASLAAREEARFREEQERRLREEELRRQKQALAARKEARESSATAVEAQVKDALAQTARMREEEEAKIKAALAGIRSGRFSDTITPGETTPVQEDRATRPVVIPQAEIEQAQAAQAPQQPAFEEPAAPEIPAAPEAPAAPAAEAAPAAPETVATAADEIEAAHRHTRSQIDEMAKAREDFFADFPDADEIKAKAAEPDLGHTRVVSKDDLMADIDTTKEISREALQAEGAELAPAAEPKEIDFKEQMNEIDDLLSQFASISGADKAKTPEAPEVQPVFEPPTESVFKTPADIPFEAPAETPFETPVEAPVEVPVEAPVETPVEAPVETPAEAPQEETLADVLAAQAAEEPTMAISDQDEETLADALAAMEAQEAERQAQEAAAAEAAAAAAAAAPAQTEAAAAEAAAVEALSEEKPGLEDTMVVPLSKDEVREALTEEGESEETLSPKEQKKRDKAKAKEAKRQAKEDKRARKAADVEDTFGEEEYVEEAPAKGGVGRTILMIILIILCIIFALELAGIGIKLLAPTSDAAAFIDNILNSLIHMITGSNGGMA